MIDMKKYPQVLLCYSIAKQAHKGQKDKGGHPYLEHCIAVAEMQTEPELVAAALIHDIFEDTDFTQIDLVKYGIDPGIIGIADILTRREDETYKEYIKRVGVSSKARKIKIADLIHNMRLDRLIQITDKDMQRVEKRYKPAYEYLTALERQEKEKGEDDGR